MKTFLLIVATICMYQVQAQNNYFYINWDINTPLVNTSWISNTSSSGARIGYRGFIEDDSRLSLGIDVSFANFDTYKTKETFVGKGGAVTTDYFNYLYQIGATASAQYYFPLGDGERFFPYAGLGVGATHHEYKQYYNIYSSAEKKWGFLARPEAGILVRFNKNRGLGAMAAVHYDYTSNKSENFGYKNFSSVGFQIGILVMNRY